MISDARNVAVREVTVNSYISVSKLPAADFVINPYIGCPHKCMYCYAEFMKRFVPDHDSEEWGDFVDVKLCNKPILVKDGASILFGSVTDPYNPYEAEYKITRSILQQLILNGSANKAKFEILTKSNLILRDLDLLKSMPNIRVGISMNTLDDNFRRQIEPYASAVEKRIDTLSALKENGVDTYLFMSPIFPIFTKFDQIVMAVRPFINTVYFENLNLRGAYKPRILRYIKKNYPEIFELFSEIYVQRKNDYWNNLLAQIDLFCNQNDIPYKTYFHNMEAF